MERSEDIVVKKIKLNREMNAIKKYISTYLAWCTLSEIDPTHPKALTLYIQLQALMAECRMIKANNTLVQSIEPERDNL